MSSTRDELLEQIGLEVRTHQNAQDLFDETACVRLGINRTDSRALDVVDQHGTIAAGKLAHELRLSTGAITGVLDRLERAGYLKRTPDATDRRKTLVQLTELARTRSWAIWGPMAESFPRAFERYTNTELELIRDFLAFSREFLQTHQARVEAMPPMRPPPSTGGEAPD